MADRCHDGALPGPRRKLPRDQCALALLSGKKLGSPYVQESLQLLATSLSSVRLCPASGDVSTSDDDCQMRLLIGDFNQAAYGGLMRVLQDRGLRVKQLVRMQDEPCDAFVEEAAGPAAVGMAVSDGARLLTKGAHHPLAVTLLALLPLGGPGAAGPGPPGAAAFTDDDELHPSLHPKKAGH